MAIIKKQLFPQNLNKYSVLVNDIDPNSKYFNITELPNTFTGGKNAFLVAGSENLVPDTLIKIEIKDAKGNIIYNEPGQGLVSSSFNGEVFVGQYYEGVSKVVAVYVYPDTAYGPCTITILGELSSYYDNNNILTPVPDNWQNTYNVKWQKVINVNPDLANTTKIRFYKRPTPNITEIVQPIYQIISGSKVNSGIYQSFANIQLSQLETFAGDVKRVKVFRTSQGDISDYDLIQDILVEAKELLTTYTLSGSVVGTTGIFTSETLFNFWNTGSLYAQLTSSRVEDGLALSGSGILTYSRSLDLNSTNTYELSLNAFYSGTINSNLGIYLSQVTSSIQNGIPVPIIVSSSIATLNGITPTKNLYDTVIPFKISNNYPSASLYFSQSNGEWHLGNVSLKLSQDTAFSPDSVSFVTTMPTVVGNETYNFKFEFYDVNNNYVPVYVTQSAVFSGGTNFNSIALSISSSTSSSLGALNRVSSSISGTMTVYSSSASSSVGIVSGSVFNLSGSVSTSVQLLTGSISSSLSSSFGYASSSVYTLSGSVSSSQSALSASISRSVYNSLTQSFTYVQSLANGNYSGSFISGNIIYAPVIGGQLGYFSTLFKVGQSPNSIYLDARQTPRKIFIGGTIPSGETEYSGAYNNTNTNVYLDSDGQFSLGNKLIWDGTTLSVTGNINISGGDAATKISNAASSGSNAQATANSAASAASTAQSTANSAASAAATAQSAADTAAGKIFTDAAGKIIKAAAPTGKGLFLDSTHLGFYNTTDFPSAPWRTYMNDSGQFYLAGDSNNGLTWDGSSLSIDGNITARNGTFYGNITSTATISGGTISGGTITGGTISIGSGNSIFKADSNGIYLGNTTFASAPFKVSMLGGLTTSAVTITGGTISIGSKFNVASDGQVSATGGTFSGAITAGNGSSIGGWTISNSSIYVNNGITLDAISKKITIFDGSGTARVYFSTGSALSDLITGGSSGGGTKSATYLNTITATNVEYVDTITSAIPTTAGLITNITINCQNNVGTQGFRISAAGSTQIYFALHRFRIYVVNNSTSAETDIVGYSSNSYNGYTTLQPNFESFVDASDGTLAITGTGDTYTLKVATMVIYGTGASVSVTANTPEFTWAYSIPVGATEIVPGGMQVVYSSGRYLKVPRTSSGTFVDIKGGFTADSKAFRITHPLDETKWLYHSSIEGPRIDNLYRGYIQLNNGNAIINLDQISNMMNGTWIKLNRDPQFFLQNMTGWDRVRGNISENILSIECENTGSLDTISYMVIGERQDDDVKATWMTDDIGKLVIERNKIDS